MAGLVLLALAVRLPGLTQSLTLDEPHAYVIAQGSFAEIFRELRAGYEIHPPLFFVLAWVGGQIGDPAVWVRGPSFFFGLATVPLTYLLAARYVERRAALFAGAIMALSPFAVRWSTDARPYCTLMFFVVLSTLFLLRAADSGRRLYWALYVGAAAAVIYTHYFGGFVLAAQAAWALWACRDRIREPLIAYAAVAVAFAPWVPSLLAQPHETSDFTADAPLTPRWMVDGALGAFPGTGWYPWRALPGRPSTFALVAALALAVAAAGWIMSRRRSVGAASPRALLLIGAMVLALPVALLAMSLVGDNVWLGRYLGIGLPAFAVLLGWAILSLPRVAGIAVAALVLCVLGVATVRGFEDRFSRAAYKDAARFIDSRAGPRDPVLEFYVGGGSGEDDSHFISPIDLNFERRHPTFLSSQEATSRAFENPPPRGRVFVAGLETGPFRLPRPGPANPLRLESVRVFPGDAPVAVYVYRATGRS
jgi:4-amino-4-deoxy-L-arabinose transferase-like glycosyltransferase